MWNANVDLTTGSQPCRTTRRKLDPSFPNVDSTWLCNVLTVEAQIANPEAFLGRAGKVAAHPRANRLIPSPAEGGSGAVSKRHGSDTRVVTSHNAVSCYFELPAQAALPQPLQSVHPVQRDRDAALRIGACARPSPA